MPDNIMMVIKKIGLLQVAVPITARRSSATPKGVNNVFASGEEFVASHLSSHDE